MRDASEPQSAERRNARLGSATMHCIWWTWPWRRTYAWHSNHLHSWKTSCSKLVGDRVIELYLLSSISVKDYNSMSCYVANCISCIIAEVHCSSRSIAWKSEDPFQLLRNKKISSTMSEKDSCVTPYPSICSLQLTMGWGVFSFSCWLMVTQKRRRQFWA